MSKYLMVKRLNVQKMQWKQRINLQFLFKVDYEDITQDNFEHISIVFISNIEHIIDCVIVFAKTCEDL